MSRKESDKPQVLPLIMPTLEQAIANWRAARRRFMERSGSEVLDRYHLATHILFICLLGEATGEPWAVEFFQAFRASLSAMDDADQHPAPALPLLLR